MKCVYVMFSYLGFGFMASIDYRIIINPTHPAPSLPLHIFKKKNNKKTTGFERKRIARLGNETKECNMLG